MLYQIRIRGKLDESWSEWLGHVESSREPEGVGAPRTTLVVDVKDPAELFGILDRIRDLNLPLVSVRELGSEEP